MKAIRALTIAMSIFLLGCIACARTDLASPENFKHFKGIVTHVYKNTFVVESDDGQKMTFRAGRDTVFIPRLARRMRDFLFAGMSVQAYYLIKPDSKGYYTAFEVRILD